VTGAAKAWRGHRPQFADEGCHVAIADIDYETAKKTAGRGIGEGTEATSPGV